MGLFSQGPRSPFLSKPIKNGEKLAFSAFSPISSPAFSIENAAVGIENVRSSIPNATSSIPNAASTIPNATSSRPNAASTIPNAASSIPNATSSIPNAASSIPNAASSIPNAPSSTPNAASSIPNAVSSPRNAAFPVGFADGAVAHGTPFPSNAADGNVEWQEMMVGDVAGSDSGLAPCPAEACAYGLRADGIQHASPFSDARRLGQLCP